MPQFISGFRYSTPHLLEEIALFGEGGLDGRGRGGDRGAGAMALRVDQVGLQIVDHREEDEVERLLLMVHVEQVVHVRDADLGREAGVDGAALGAGLVHLLGSVVGVDEIFVRDAQRFKVSAEQPSYTDVLIQDARDADAQRGAALHGRDAGLLAGGDGKARQRVRKLASVGKT